MSAVAIAVIAAAAAVDLVLVRALRPASAGAALLLAVWLLTPGAMSLAWLVASRASRRQSAAAGIVTTLVAAAATSHLIDAIYVHPDAQGAIAVVLTPIYAMAALVVLAPLSAWLAARRWPFR